jgi:hypothetical protein
MGSLAAGGVAESDWTDRLACQPLPFRKAANRGSRAPRRPQSAPTARKAAPPRRTLKPASALKIARALAVARQQQAESWELRAAMSLARLKRDQGKRLGGGRQSIAKFRSTDMARAGPQSSPWSLVFFPETGRFSRKTGRQLSTNGQSPRGIRDLDGFLQKQITERKQADDSLETGARPLFPFFGSFLDPPASAACRRSGTAFVTEFAPRRIRTTMTARP